MDAHDGRSRLSEVGLEFVDSTRTYTDDENQRINANLVDLLREIHSGQWSCRDLGIDLVCELNERLFKGVRSFGGRYRTVGRGSEYLEFGPNRSAHSSEVERRLRRAFRVCSEDIKDARGLPVANRAEETFKAAVHLHAEVVRIHPFEDGNGRSSRALLDLVLIANGMPPIPVNMPKSTYNEALNLYHSDQDRQAIVDFFLALLLDDPS